jgi:RNA polymerase sigma factor (sigma-70 family)
MSNEKFLEEVYLSKRPLLVSFCTRMTGSVESAEDVVQTGFLKAWDYPGRFADSNHCFHFLQLCCRNACINLIRRRAAWKRVQAKLQREASEKALMVAEALERYEREERVRNLHVRAHPVLCAVCAERNLPLKLFLERGAIVRYAREHGIKESTLRSRCKTVLRQTRSRLKLA